MYLAIGLKDSITRLFKGERKESCWLEAHSDQGLGRRTARRLSENGHFPQSLHQAQISILKILNVFLRLKSSPSLTLHKIPRSRTASYEGA